MKVSWRDGQNLPAPTVKGFQALTAEGAAGVLVNGTDPLLAAAPLAERLKTIVFNIAAVTPAQRKLNDYVFGNAVLADTESKQMVDTMKSALGLSSLSIIYDDNSFGDMFKTFLIAAAKAKGMQVIRSVPVKPGAADLRPQLRPLLESSPHQAIVLASTGVTPGTAIKQAKEMGVKAQYWVGEQFTWMDESLKAAGMAAEGAIATTPLFDRGAGMKAKKFAEDYEKRYGIAVYTLGARAYDAIYAMATAAKKANSCDGSKVRNELVKLSHFEGVTGTLDFSERIAEGLLTWGQVQGGKVIAIPQSQLIRK